MLIHLSGGTALHLQHLRPAIIFIFLLIVFDVLQGKKKREREKMNEEFGSTVQVCNVAKLAAWLDMGDNTTGPCLLQTGR